MPVMPRSMLSGDTIKHQKMLQVTSLVLIVLAVNLTHLSRQETSLEIDIVNIQKNGGNVIVEIYKDKSTWLESPFRRVTLPGDNSSKTASVQIPEGRYAISIYQDRNKNGKLDRSFIGIPKEPIGFGNNYRPFGKPGFESAAIQHKPGSKPQAIKLFTVF